MGVAWRLEMILAWQSLKYVLSETYLAMAQPMVWTLHPWVSLIPRVCHRMKGATPQAQKSCHDTEGHLNRVSIDVMKLEQVRKTHHSQPRPICISCSMWVPVTSVPGIPQVLCHLREMMYMKTVMKSWVYVSHCVIHEKLHNIPGRKDPFRRRRAF